MKTLLKDLFILTLGMLVTAVAIYYFVLPSQLIIGSISGLSIVISGVLAKVGINIKVSIIILIINAFLLILAYLMLGKECGLKTVYASLILGPLMELCEWIYPYTNLLTEPGQISVMGDLWFDLLCYVLLISAAQAILFFNNASTGGTDIIALILNKYLHLDIGTSVSFLGIIICFTAFAIHPFRMVVIGILGTWFNGIVIDYFTAGLKKRKRVCIISSEYEEIRSYIIKELERGCTLYEIVGGYTGEKCYEIQTLLTQYEFSKLMDYMKNHDIRAFTTAGNVTEIYGRWHKSHYHNKHIIS